MRNPVSEWWGDASKAVTVPQHAASASAAAAAAAAVAVAAAAASKLTQRNHRQRLRRLR